MNISKSQLKPFWRKNLWLVSVNAFLALLFSPLILLITHLFQEKLTKEDIKLFYEIGWKLFTQDYQE